MPVGHLTNPDFLFWKKMNEKLQMCDLQVPSSEIPFTFAGPSL
jgi:hypothetical protein